jgi:hypothetical protein
VLVAASLLQRGGQRVAPAAAAGAGSGAVYQLTIPDRSPAARSAGYRKLLRALHAAGRAEVASLTNPGAVIGLGPADMMVTHCGECVWADLIVEFHTFDATHLVVSADTFQALGLHLAAGRWFTDADDWRAPRVAVVNRWLADRHFQNGDAVGRTLHVGHGSESWYTVVGVVDDLLPAGLGGALEPREAVYLSALQHPPTAADLLVRGRGAPDEASAVEATVRDTFGRRVGIRRVSEASVFAAETAPLEWFAGMFDVEGVAILAIATIGTCAMMWLWVTSLLAELGVRRALGARRRTVLAYVLWRALLVAAAGAAFGTWLGMMVWDALGNVVVGVPAWDPAAVLRYALLLGAAALAGALVPAWRAAHAPPTALLSS